MSKVKKITFPKPVPVLFSDGIIFGDILSVSGMLPTDTQGQLIGKNDITLQTEQVFQNIKAVLDAAGASFEDVVKLTIYLRDIRHRTDLAPIRQKYFGDHKPSSTLVAVSGLANPDALLEIEALVYLGK
jgi:2-iminobutanoate/2-iminopropanoate deaminase